MKKLIVLLVLSSFAVSFSHEPDRAESDLEIWCIGFGRTWDETGTCLVEHDSDIYSSVHVSPGESLVINANLPFRNIFNEGNIRLGHGNYIFVAYNLNLKFRNACKLVNLGSISTCGEISNTGVIYNYHHIVDYASLYRGHWCNGSINNEESGIIYNSGVIGHSNIENLGVIYNFLCSGNSRVYPPTGLIVDLDGNCFFLPLVVY